MLKVEPYLLNMIPFLVECAPVLVVGDSGTYLLKVETVLIEYDTCSC